MIGSKLPSFSRAHFQSKVQLLLQPELTTKIDQVAQVFERNIFLILNFLRVNNAEVYLSSKKGSF